MHIVHNGTFYSAGERTLHHSNRAFRYGDGFFESMVMFNAGIPLLALHFARMQEASQILKYDLHPDLNIKSLQNILARISEIDMIKHARIRITVYRDTDGFYAPENNTSGYLMEWQEIPNDQFVWHDSGLKTGLYTEIKKPVNAFSRVKTCNALLYVLAGIYKKDTGADECFILNESGNVCEGISSNFFWSTHGVFYTPPLQEGCVGGVMRLHILKLLGEENIPVAEKACTTEDLQKADELFFCSASRGLQWVKELHAPDFIREYSHNTSTVIFQKLTASLR